MGLGQILSLARPVARDPHPGLHVPVMTGNPDPAGMTIPVAVPGATSVMVVVPAFETFDFPVPGDPVAFHPGFVMPRNPHLFRG